MHGHLNVKHQKGHHLEVRYVVHCVERYKSIINQPERKKKLNIQVR